MTDKKRINFILWVDDYGQMKLPRENIEWYHKNAGPITFAIENDEWFPCNIKNTTSKISEYDYVAHHFHPMKLKTNKTLYNAFNNLKMAFIDLTGNQHIFYKFLRNGKRIIFRDQHQQELMHDDEKWMHSQIRKAKEEFQNAGREYKVIRHGWCLPPKKMNEFYKKIGLKADASATPMPPENHPKLGKHEVKWIHDQPYYTSLKNGFGIKAKSEKDRGLIELPVNLSNVQAFEIDTPMIELADDEALISAYIHPGDGFEKVRKLVNYLKENYKVEFTRPDLYLENYKIK